MLKIKEDYPISEFEKKVEQLLLPFKKKKKPLILIQGGYGKKNTGDDALLLVISKKVKDILPNARILALCHYPENIRNSYNIDACYFASFRTIKALLTAQILIIGGGGIVNNINTFSGFRLMKLFDMKGKFLFLTSLFMRLRFKKVIFYVVGMTSIPDGGVKFLMKLVLPIVNLLAVRDPLSLNILKKLKLDKNVFLTHDPAIDLQEESDITKLNDIYKKENIDESKKKIAINVRYVADESINTQTVEEISKFVLDILKKYPDFQIIFFPISFHPEKRLEDDYKIGQDIKTKVNLPDNQFLLLQNYYNPRITKALLKGMDYLILSRLHAVILSHEYSIPTVILSYDNKVEQFGKMIESDENIMSLQTVKSDKLVKKIENFF